MRQYIPFISLIFLLGFSYCLTTVSAYPLRNQTYGSGGYLKDNFQLDSDKEFGVTHDSIYDSSFEYRSSQVHFEYYLYLEADVALYLDSASIYINSQEYHPGDLDSFLFENRTKLGQNRSEYRLYINHTQIVDTGVVDSIDLLLVIYFNPNASTEEKLTYIASTEYDVTDHRFLLVVMYICLFLFLLSTSYMMKSGRVEDISRGISVTIMYFYAGYQFLLTRLLIDEPYQVMLFIPIFAVVIPTLIDHRAGKRFQQIIDQRLEKFFADDKSPVLKTRVFRENLRSNTILMMLQRTVALIVFSFAAFIFTDPEVSYLGTLVAFVVVYLLSPQVDGIST